MKKLINSMISDTDIEVVTVGSYNLPTDVITKKEDVLGKFAAVDLKKGDYLLPSKVTSVSDSADDVFRTLDGTKQAISVTIQSFAGGLSGKLENGDIVQLAVYDNDTGKAILPGAFTYMKVITTTTDGGFDKDEVPVNDDGTVELPSTITLLANSAQIKLLVEYENRGKIHADLVYRGDAETAQKFLDAQDAYFKNLAETEKEDSETEEDEDEGGFDIVKYAKYNYIKSTPEVTAENVLNRDFTAEAPNEKWLTDVTEFKYYVGPEVKKLYLSAILDLYDRRILAYKIGDSNNNELVFSTFDEAVAMNPDARPLFHSDRGFQYTNKTFHNKLMQAGMRQSMSRVGHCIDNGPMEGYWGILKSEMYYLHKFTDRNQLVSAIENYIQFYNTKRYQLKLGCMTPMEYHAAFAA